MRLRKMYAEMNWTSAALQNQDFFDGLDSSLTCKAMNGMARELVLQRIRLPQRGVRVVQVKMNFALITLGARDHRSDPFDQRVPVETLGHDLHVGLDMAMCPTVRLLRRSTRGFQGWPAILTCAGAASSFLSDRACTVLLIGPAEHADPY